jgi:hypothetical protein
MKWFKIRPDKKEITQLEKQLSAIELNCLSCFNTWDNMLYLEDKTLVLESHSGDGLAIQFENFQSSGELDGGLLGSIEAIDEKRFSVENELHQLSIKFRQISLKEGFTKEQYRAAVNQYKIYNERATEIKFTMDTLKS